MVSFLVERFGNGRCCDVVSKWALEAPKNPARFLSFSGFLQINPRHLTNQSIFGGVSFWGTVWVSRCCRGVQFGNEHHLVSVGSVCSSNKKGR